MIVHYIDPSAWVKRYFLESGSEGVGALFRGSPDAACCRLGLVEMIATVARKISQSSVEQAVVNALVEGIRADFAAFREVRLDDGVLGEAMDLASRHRLRAVDAVHLASALSLRGLGEVVMVSADLELLAAARVEQIGTLNPATA